MSSEGFPGNGQSSGDAGQPRMQILAQYVKDLSFENPGAPLNQQVRPAIDLGVDLHARRVGDNQYETELRLRVSAKHEDKTLFLLEMSYAAVVFVSGVPDDVVQQVLLIETPHMIFPFARRVVADTIRDGGMPPLMIEPMDFAAIYRAKTEEQQRGVTAPA